MKEERTSGNLVNEFAKHSTTSWGMCAFLPIPGFPVQVGLQSILIFVLLQD